ncbi:MAG: 3-phosphoshikimate 1-carboxyvinyltransferase [Verrucomicrobiales bacterium]
MPEVLPIAPYTAPLADPEVTLPGSKSLTNRALILAAMGEGETALSGALFSRDTRLMLAALKALGFSAAADEPAREIRLAGGGGSIPAASADLGVGNAGTVARFLPALLALRAGGEFRIDGDEAMRARPIAPLLQALADLGAAEADFSGEPGCYPFALRTAGYRGGEGSLDARASSQMLSALLMALPCARADATTLRLTGGEVRRPFVEMTLAAMRQFGVGGVEEIEPGTFRIPGRQTYRAPGGRYRIEPDATAASYFLALPRAAGGALRLPGLGTEMLQGDTAFAAVIAQAGIEITRAPGGWSAEFRGRAAAPIDADFSGFSDTFLTLAALAPILGVPVTIRGIAHTRHQETDRVAGMANELRKLIGEDAVTEEEGALHLRPDPGELRRRAAQGLPPVETYEDHRFAMSFGILGSHDLLGNGQPWLQIKDPACCAKTFPDFFEALDSLRPRRQ